MCYRKIKIKGLSKILQLKLEDFLNNFNNIKLLIYLKLD